MLRKKGLYFFFIFLFKQIKFDKCHHHTLSDILKFISKYNLFIKLLIFLGFGVSCL